MKNDNMNTNIRDKMPLFHCTVYGTAETNFTNGSFEISE